MFSDADVERFVAEGFLQLPGAVPEAVTEACRAQLWQASGCAPEDPSTWTRPVVRVGGLSGAPFREAANTGVLRAAYDRLAGEGRWQAPQGLGTFPLRFPSSEDPGDAGWHLDAGCSDAGGGYRVTLRSHGRALLMLFLFTDVAAADAPTRIRAGSHRDVAPLLDGFSELPGREWFDLCGAAVEASAHRPVVDAVGRAGDVFLCHPFLVHTAQPHRGTAPRFIAQPPLEPTAPLDLDASVPTPVERAVQEALAQA
ncbi:phytanoyl-CoA dioxygenase family protein [Streptomonospora wellingtoniae]|uniref:Phytanoyl-CoA dioxygenase family protein n=1 Tax=Streptomonospora wellingtoniae TaxID=3075544 RepID=A0ABU2KX97_9ACTN|nr:phytanoyl-CoA dioxygenase family protein [Streptomonospora sp. DSM 45055]MDT0303718.1 phytanoyl-CoA dioxygenase family protein [Streptomonospora sp. DSM 45055]